MSELIGEWVSIEIGQSKVSDSEYEFYINVNGITVHKVELENPEIIDAAKIYATPPNMEAANGNELRNIFFNSQRLPLPLSAKSGVAETSGRAMAKEGGQGQGSKDREWSENFYFGPGTIGFGPWIPGQGDAFKMKPLSIGSKSQWKIDCLVASCSPDLQFENPEMYSQYCKGRLSKTKFGRL